MTPQQWTRVNALFHEALALPGAQRADWLRAAAGAADEVVLAEVRALLEAHEQDPAFLEAGVQMGQRASDHGAADVGPAPSLVGRRIGAYEVTREIGRGGMGVVFLAHDTRLGRDVAIKALPHAQADDPQRRERLRREARAAAALTHAGIATVYALEEDASGELFLVSEYVRGETLRDELARGPLSFDTWLATAIELAQAIGAAHAQGIIHRDLKPENVIRTPTGSVKILDFGLARAMTPWLWHDASVLTRSGVLLGTPAYMAPEQLRGDPVDARADLFSLGALLYELASGRHPFDASALGLTLDRLQHAAPDPLTQVLPGFPAFAWEVVNRCLRKTPAERYASAEEVVIDLEQRASTMATTAARASSTESEPASSQWWWRFHQLAVSAFFTAAIVPAWHAFELIPSDLARGLLRTALLVAIAGGVSLRLHLWFVSRHDPPGLADQRRRSSRWIAASDWAFVLTLAVGAMGMMGTQAVAAAVVMGVAVCYLVAFSMIEPATARAAFRSR